MDYRISADGLYEGIAVFRYEGDSVHLEYANVALRELLHFSLDTMAGADYSSILESVHPDDADHLNHMIKSLPRTKTGTCTHRFKDYADGSVKWLTAHGSYVDGPDGPRGYFAYQDITEHKDATDRERNLAHCIRLLTCDTDTWEANVTAVMESVKGQYCADRCYIFEFDWDANKMSNTYEVVGSGVNPEKDFLQDLPTEIVSHWLPRFRAGEAVFIDDLEAIKDDPVRKDEYEVLAPQDIHSLMVVPISRGDFLYGYFGVDNPASHQVDKAFLTTVAQVLSQEYLSRAQKEEMRILSLTDPLTKMNNRHAFNSVIDDVGSETKKGIGVVFADVNGLKYINDNFGHAEGDRLIQKGAYLLEQYFPKERAFRISGDEFVCVLDDIDEAAFGRLVERLRLDASSEYGAVFSIGCSWCASDANHEVTQMIGDAEELMYRDKEQFYLDFPFKSRKSVDDAR